jgi:nicotinamide-nucleotide amidase
VRETSPDRMPPDPHPLAPSAPVCAHLLTIGDEILAGDIVNTNAAFLGTRCRRIGLTVVRAQTVRDRVSEIVPAILEATRHARVCLVCGGLGPTSDDLTTVAVAEAAGVGVRRDAAALARLEAKFAALGRAMPEANRKQADFPAGADILDNPIGSAEGFALDLGGCRVFVMPGVPRELHKMMREQVEPWISEHLDLREVPRRIYRMLGRGESAVAEAISPVLAQARTRSPGLAAMFVHYRASMPEVQVVLEGTPGPDGVGATQDELAELDAPLLDAMGGALYGIGSASLAPRVIEGVRRAGHWIGTAESCTGGGVGQALASVPGASACFAGGIIAYDNRIKIEKLGVAESLLHEHGAVSEAVACAMAEGGRRALGVDLCVAITGIAGPSGGTPEKPVGTVHIAVCDADGSAHRRVQLRGDRGTVQRAAGAWALKLAWDRLGLRPSFMTSNEH